PPPRRGAHRPGGGPARAHRLRPRKHGSARGRAPRAGRAPPRRGVRTGRDRDREFAHDRPRHRGDRAAPFRLRRPLRGSRAGRAPRRPRASHPLLRVGQSRRRRDVGLAPGGVVMSSYVHATYELETSLPLQQAAEILAGEQSTGTFVRVERETDDLRARFAAQVASLEELPLTGSAPLPGSVGDPRMRRRARLVIRYPLDNFGPSIPNLLAAVAGNLYEIKELAAIRLVDLDLPAEFAVRYAGPRFGLTGTRELMNAPTGVLLGTIIKPSIGLAPHELAEVVDELAT